MNDYRNNRPAFATARGGSFSAVDAGTTGDLSAARRRAGTRPSAREGWRYARAERDAKGSAAARGASDRPRRGSARRGTASASTAGSARTATRGDRPRASRGEAMRGGVSREQGRSARAGRRTPAEHAGSTRGNNAFMRYAGDNRVVQAIYDFTTGPLKPFFIIAVVAVVLVSIYFPVRDCYVAYRTSDILARQLELREAYNERLESDVDQLLSTEGIEAAARENLGLVMPGEKRIDVVGAEGLADEDAAGDASSDGDAQGEAGEGQDGSASGAGDEASTADDASGSQDEGAQDAAEGDAADADAEEGGAAAGTDVQDEGAATGEPTNAQELEDAERAVVLDAPWYINVLDTIFFYQGVDGQTVVSAGE